MATVKVKFRPSSVGGKEGAVYYQVIHNRTVRQVKTRWRLLGDEWDGAASAVVHGRGGSAARWDYVESAIEGVRWDLRRLRMIVARCDGRPGGYTADDVVAEFARGGAGPSLLQFMQAVISRLRRLGRMRTAETYSSALSSFMKFSGGRDVPLDDVDGDLAELYESWMRSAGLCPNTVSFYMRILRAVYNRAVVKGLTAQRHPFARVYTGVDKTVKRALPLAAVRRLKQLDLAGRPALDFARDMFMFSFYTRGMSFVDMAFLRKTDVACGTLVYRRRKTGQALTVKWEKCMADIAAKYGGRAPGPYLLPIITRPGGDARRQYRNTMNSVNKALKLVAAAAGIEARLTMYCARHAWASIARSKNIPVAVISEGMGHDSEKTTRIYLASLDTSVVDRANSKIIRSL